MNNINSQIYNKNNLIIRSTVKKNIKKKYFPSRSNTQEVPHKNININNFSTDKSKKKNKQDNSMNNKKDEQIKKFNNLTNVTSSLNSDFSNKSNSQNYKSQINQYNEIMNQKDKEIFELEKKVKLYKEKLNYLKKNKNINSSLNSFNLSKTRSSSNFTERNIIHMQSMSKSQAKIKTSFSLAANLYLNKNVDKKIKNEEKIRPKSNNYRKPKIDILIINKNSHNYKKNNINLNNKSKNMPMAEIIYYNKRPKSSKIKNKKNVNIIFNKSNNCNNNKANNLLTLEETQNLCDKIIKKMKFTLELVKAATMGE